jgi:hypothetical protein
MAGGYWLFDSFSAGILPASEAGNRVKAIDCLKAALSQYPPASHLPMSQLYL